MIPRSISYIYYLYPKLYRPLTALLTVILWFEGQWLDKPLLVTSGFMAWGLSWVAGAYKDDSKLAFFHYFYAALWATPLIYYTGLQTLWIALGSMSPFVLLYIISKKHNYFLLVFELVLFGTAQYYLLQ